MSYEIKKIEGVNCVFVSMPSASTITVQAFVKVGSACENEINSGISHFLEHMICNGSERRASKLEFEDFKVDNGVRSNAFTNPANTKFYFEHPKNKHTLGLELLSDWLINPAMREEDIESEKGVILQEFQRALSNNDRKFLELAQEQFYQGRQKCNLGSESSIKAMTRKNLLERKNMRYSKDNLLLVITGGFEKQDDFEQLIAEKFADLPESKTGIYQMLKVDQNQKSEFVFDLGLKQSQIKLYMPLPYQNREHAEALDILANIAGFGSVGKLYKKLRYELSLAYAIHMRYLEMPIGNKLIIEGGVTKEREYEGIDAIHQVLDELLNGISQEDFERAKLRTMYAFDRGTETSKWMNDFIGSQRLLGGELLTVEEKKKKINEVTLQELNDQLSFLVRENRRLFIAH